MRRRRTLAAVGAAVALAGLAGCGGGSSAPTSGPQPVAGGSSSGSTDSSSPAAGPTPHTGSGHRHTGSSSPPAPQSTATKSAAHRSCPVTDAEVQHAFGWHLKGPKPPLNAYEACVFRLNRPAQKLVAQVTVYTTATLQTLGTTARAYMHGNRQPNATTVHGLGVEAFVQETDVWVRTGTGDVLDIGTNFTVKSSALEQIARDAVQRL